MPATAIAEGLGYSNVRTNTFSSSLSSARQFGLLAMADERYTLTALARSILHPIEPGTLPRLRREAFREPPLYASLSSRFQERRLPDPTALANIVYHHDGITASAKQAAAEAFLASARFAELVDADGALRSREGPTTEAAILPQSPEPTSRQGGDATLGVVSQSPGAPSSPDPARAFRSEREPAPVRIDLRLWGADAGKVLRVRAPESITAESYDRLLAALRLHIQVVNPDVENS